MINIKLADLVRKRPTKEQSQWVQHNPWMSIIWQLSDVGLVVAIDESESTVDIVMYNGVLLEAQKSEEWEIVKDAH